MILTAAAFTLPQSASAAACDNAWKGASWGRVKFCTDFTNGQLTRIYGTTQDLKSDGWCVVIAYWTSGTDYGISMAEVCGKNKKKGYSIKADRGEHITDVELRQWDQCCNVGHYKTLW
jgi:hypothetical protein